MTNTSPYSFLIIRRQNANGVTTNAHIDLVNVPCDRLGHELPRFLFLVVI